jgi:hypothetical protein
MSAAIALLASCSAEQTDEPNIPQEKGGKTYLEVTATQPTIPETRMTYTEDGQDPVGMIATWSAGEKLAVASYSGEEGKTKANLLSADDYLTGGDGAAASTTFKGEISRASTGALEGKYNFYYPLSTAVVDWYGVTYDYTKQRITLEDKGGNNFVGDPNGMSQYDVLYTLDAVNPSGGITLYRLSSILRFVLPLPAGAPAIKQIEFSATSALFPEKIELSFAVEDRVKSHYKEAVNLIRLDVDGDVSTSAGRTITAYMLTPGNIAIPKGTVMTVSAIANDGAVYSYSFSRDFATESHVFRPGMTYSFAPASPLKLDSYRLSANGTANCYIIGGEGKKYAFAATVRGNGVTIEGDFPGGFPVTIGRSKDYSVSVLWSTGAHGVVSDVSYDASTGLISFIGDDTTANGASGNAVIALKDGSGEVLWSWHIWLIGTPKPDEEYGTGLYYDGKVKMMPYNLGAVNTYFNDRAVATYPYRDGLLYQWGRKDPFLGARWYTNDYNPKKGEDFKGDADFAYNGNGPVTPEEAYKHPTTFYNNSASSGDWCRDRYQNLWGNGTGDYADWSSSIFNKKYGTKTLFDPCPPGYKVPPRNTWHANFSNVSDLTFNRGYAYRYDGTATTFYPASGYRVGISLFNVGLGGYYWSSSPSGSDSRGGSSLDFKERITGPLSGFNRECGFFVRCAREKN